MENHHVEWVNQLQMAMFNSYVKLPEGIPFGDDWNPTDFVIFCDGKPKKQNKLWIFGRWQPQTETGTLGDGSMFDVIVMLCDIILIPSVGDSIPILSGCFYSILHSEYYGWCQSMPKHPNTKSYWDHHPIENSWKQESCLKPPLALAHLHVLSVLFRYVLMLPK